MNTDDEFPKESIDEKDLRILELERQLAAAENKLQDSGKRIEKDFNICNSPNEERLNEETHRLRELIYSSPSLITLLKGEDFVVEIANQAVLDFWGKDKSIIGRPLAEAHPEAREQGFVDLLQKVYKTGKAEHRYEIPAYSIKEGKKDFVNFNFVYQPQYNKSGEIEGVAVIANEVSPQAEFHKKIQESEKRYRQISDFLPHKITVGKAESTPFYYNKAWMDFSGLDQDKLIEKSWMSLIHPEDKEKVFAAVNKTKQTGENFEKELRLLDKNGKYKWHLCRAKAVKDTSGNITLWVSSSTEIQEIKEEEYRKEAFLKLVSHELKTPVTSIKGYVQLLQSMMEQPETKDKSTLPLKTYFNRMEDQIDRLIRLISEMLDLSRIEQNELELQKEKFSLNELVENVKEDIGYTYKEVNIDIDHNFICDINADKDRVGQVLINFITNAIKYSSSGKKVDIFINEKSSDLVSVSVKDNGIGIPEKDLKKIFRRFYRVEGKNKNTYAGFGIGLYLSSQIIKRHNGEISVDSKEGEGSEFTFTLPLN
ncbi:ATP-binding protein [Salegentibacter chungangensis]|uniref:histidine kinase n=1 Tax=Salegentibacter chungangensis TaxID=1335724 RepID=A0ABW3NTM2_9FLAO